MSERSSDFITSSSNSDRDSALIENPEFDFIVNNAIKENEDNSAPKNSDKKDDTQLKSEWTFKNENPPVATATIKDHFYISYINPSSDFPPKITPNADGSSRTSITKGESRKNSASKEDIAPKIIPNTNGSSRTSTTKDESRKNSAPKEDDFPPKIIPNADGCSRTSITKDESRKNSASKEDDIPPKTIPNANGSSKTCIIKQEPRKNSATKEDVRRRQTGSFTNDAPPKFEQPKEENTKEQDTPVKEDQKLFVSPDAIETTVSPDAQQSESTRTTNKKKRGNPRTTIAQQRATIAELRARVKTLEEDSSFRADDKELRALKIKEASIKVRLAEEMLAKAKLETEEARIRTNAIVKIADKEMAKSFRNNKN